MTATGDEKLSMVVVSSNMKVDVGDDKICYVFLHDKFFITEGNVTEFRKFAESEFDKFAGKIREKLKEIKVKTAIY